MAEIIRTDKLVKNYYRNQDKKDPSAKIEVLKGLDITIEDGEYVAIMGSSGGGKTTLLKILGMMEPLTEGKLYFKGQDSSLLWKDELADIRRREIGFVFQDFYLMDSLSAGENIMVPMILDKAQAEEMKQKMHGLARRFGVEKLIGKSPGELSGGEKRRLFLLSVLAAAPNVLLLDKPTNDLDIQTLSVLEDYLDSFPGAVVAVSHDRYFLDRVVRRVFAVEGDGSVRGYPGGYTEYLEARRAAGQPARSPKPAEPKAARPQGAKKLKFSYKEQREFETIDADIAALEAVLAQVQAEQEEKATDYVALQSLQERQAELEAALEEKMERWVYLNDLAEQISNQ